MLPYPVTDITKQDFPPYVCHALKNIIHTKILDKTDIPAALGVAS
jgi:hypothetical protein